MFYHGNLRSQVAESGLFTESIKMYFRSAMVSKLMLALLTLLSVQQLVVLSPQIFPLLL